jgi:hypothetical protein
MLDSTSPTPRPEELAANSTPLASSSEPSQGSRLLKRDAVDVLSVRESGLYVRALLSAEPTA